MEPTPPRSPSERICDTDRWLALCKEIAGDGWSYNYSGLAPGAYPKLAWSEYPLASIWVAHVTGLHASPRAVAVVLGEDVPCHHSGEIRTVGQALEEAGMSLLRFVERCELEASRNQEPRVRPEIRRRWDSWREIGAALLLRARQADVVDRPI